MVRLENTTSLTVAPSCTLMPMPLLESRMTQLLNNTCRMGESVSVPIIRAVDELVRMQWSTRMFSVG